MTKRTSSERGLKVMRQAYSKAIHRSRRRKRQRWFTDTGVGVGDQIIARDFCGNETLGRVKDFRLDRLNRRYLVLNDDTLARVGNFATAGPSFIRKV